MTEDQAERIASALERISHCLEIQVGLKSRTDSTSTPVYMPPAYSEVYDWRRYSGTGAVTEAVSNKPRSSPATLEEFKRRAAGEPLFSRDECVFGCCPNPRECQEKCQCPMMAEVVE